MGGRGGEGADRQACPLRWHLLIQSKQMDTHEAKSSQNHMGQQMLFVTFHLYNKHSCMLHRCLTYTSSLACTKRKKTDWHQSCRNLHMQRCIRLLQLQNKLIICETVLSAQALHIHQSIQQRQRPHPRQQPAGGADPRLMIPAACYC